MKLKNVELTDEVMHYVERGCYKPDVLNHVEKEEYSKIRGGKRTLTAILKTLEMMPVRITSSKPLVFMVREYLHREIPEKRLIWMPIHTEDYKPYELKELLSFEKLNKDVVEKKEGINNDRRSFRIGNIECRVELSNPNIYSSASINHDAIRSVLGT